MDFGASKSTFDDKIWGANSFGSDGEVSKLNSIFDLMTFDIGPTQSKNGVKILT